MSDLRLCIIDHEGRESSHAILGQFQVQDQAIRFIEVTSEGHVREWVVPISSVRAAYVDRPITALEKLL